MVGKAGEAYVEVRPELSKFGSTLAQGVEKEVGSKATQMGKSFQAVGAGMTAGVTLPLVGLGIAATKAFQESAAVAAQTEAAIKSTGGAAKISASGVSALAAEVSNYAAVDDEAVQAGENLLLTFTKVQDSVGKGRDIFTEATKAGADLAARGMGSIESNAVLLGKALNDPIAGIGRLSKVGVNFSAKQEKVITRLAESGETAKAQGVILDEVFRQVGGSAKAFGDSAAGSSAKAGITFGNAMEDMGEALAPIISGIAKVAGAMAEWFSNLGGPWKTVIVAVLVVLALVGPALLIIGTIMTSLGAIATAFGISMAAAFWWAALIALAIVAIIALAVVVVKNWDTIKRVTLAVWNAIKAFLLGVWRAIKSAALAAWNGIKALFLAAFNAIKTVVLGYFKIYEVLIIRPLLWVWGQIKKILGWISEHWRDVWNGISDFVGGIWDGIVSGVKAGANVLLGVIETAVNAFLDPFQKISTMPIIGAKIPDVPEIHIPRLAAGGIVTRPTLALVGEAGPEAVVPLRHLRSFDGAGRSVAISGTLALSEDSTAYVRGVIDEDSDARRRHSRTLERMGRQ